MKAIVIEVNVNNECMEANVTPNNIYIPDSWRIKKISDMKFILNSVKHCSLCEMYPVIERSMFGLINEWRAHNLLYKLHIAQSRTGSVDLNTHESIIRKIGYFILSILYF